MNITKISTEQFAGIVDKDVSLDSGINVLVGENGTGKSTMIEVLYQTLFTDADVAKNSVMKKNYIPNRADNVKVSIIDGVIRFETDEGSYKLKKEWVAGSKGTGQVRLTLPDGSFISDKDEVNRILGQILQYGSGVYSEIVFNSQKRESAVVRCILGGDTSKDTVIDDLGTTLKQAELETGGVSINAMEKKIDENLSELGEHWDFSLDCPERRRGISDPWRLSKDNNGILKAYYACETARSEYNRVISLENKIDAIDSRIGEVRSKHDGYSGKLATFNKFRAAIERKSHLEDIIKANMVQCNERTQAYNSWPVNSQKLEAAKKLKIQLESAALKDRFERVNSRYVSYQDLDKKLAEAIIIDEQDYKIAKQAERDISRLQSQLCDMNISAKISKLSDSYTVVIKSIATGEEIVPVDGNYVITEAVKLIIPDVMEIELAPGDVDVEAVSKNITAANNTLTSIYTKYDVKNSDEIKAKMDTYNQLVKNTENAKRMFQDALDNADWDKLQETVKQLPADTKSLSEVKEMIVSLCGTASIDGFIGALTTKCNQYEDKYTSMDVLQSYIEENKSAIDKNQKLLDSMEAIPAEFETISNPDQYAQDLEDKIKNCLRNMDALNSEKMEVSSTIGDKSSSEYKTEYEALETEVNHRKLMYSRWANIKDKFVAIKSATGGNSIDDIENNFKKYLNIISDGEVEIVSMDDKLSISLKAKKNKLTSDNISSGTRELVALAFRLSMLEHIFPEGNGFAVFDDPFVNMSDTRAQRACELVKEFAKNNQVIFVTCHEKYHGMLGGNLVTIK